MLFFTFLQRLYSSVSLFPPCDGNSLCGVGHIIQHRLPPIASNLTDCGNCSLIFCVFKGSMCVYLALLDDVECAGALLYLRNPDKPA